MPAPIQPTMTLLLRGRPALLLAFLVLIAPVAPGRGAPPPIQAPAAPVPEAPAEEEDLWYVVELLGRRAGYFHTDTRRTTFRDVPVLRVREVLRNQISRINAGVTEDVVVTSSTTRYETLDGRTLLIEHLLDQGGGPLSSRVEVQGKRARVTLSSVAGERHFEIPWDETVLSPRVAEAAIDELVKGPAESLDYKAFSFEAGSKVMDMKARVVERLEGGGAVVEQEFVGLGIKGLETYDAAGVLQRQEIGPVVLRLSDRGEALAPVEADLEVFRRIRVRLDRKLPPRPTTAAYRLAPRPGAEGLLLERLFVEDGRQSIEPRTGGGVLRVKALDLPYAEPSAAFDPAPFLAPSSLIESDDPQVREVARRVAGEQGGALDRARRLERWVHENVRFSGAGIGLASARQTLDLKDGDCTENAFLLAALLRATEIPSRVVVGLVAAGEEEGKSVLVPHAWVEAYDGGWLALDAAIHGPAVDATHLAMGKSDGSEEGALIEISLPLLEGLGRFDLEWAGEEPDGEPSSRSSR